MYMAANNMMDGKKTIFHKIGAIFSGEKVQEVKVKADSLLTDAERALAEAKKKSFGEKIREWKIWKKLTFEDFSILAFLGKLAYLLVIVLLLIWRKDLKKKKRVMIIIILLALGFIFSSLDKENLTFGRIISLGIFFLVLSRLKIVPPNENHVVIDFFGVFVFYSLNPKQVNGNKDKKIGLNFYFNFPWQVVVIVPTGNSEIEIKEGNFLAKETVPFIADVSITGSFTNPKLAAQKVQRKSDGTLDIETWRTDKILETSKKAILTAVSRHNIQQITESDPGVIVEMKTMVDTALGVYGFTSHDNALSNFKDKDGSSVIFDLGRPTAEIAKLKAEEARINREEGVGVKEQDKNKAIYTKKKEANEKYLEALGVITINSNDPIAMTWGKIAEAIGQPYDKIASDSNLNDMIKTLDGKVQIFAGPDGVLSLKAMKESLAGIMTPNP